MAIFSDMELLKYMNEGKEENIEGSIDKLADRVKHNAEDIKDAARNAKDRAVDNAWITKHKKKKQQKNSGKVTFKEDADGNIIDCDLDSFEESEIEVTEGIKDKAKDIIKDLSNKSSIGMEKSKQGITNTAEKVSRDLTNKSAVEIEKEKQDWQQNAGAKTGELIGDIATGGNVVNTTAKFVGRKTGGIVDKIIARRNSDRKKLKEESEVIYRYPEFTQAMNEYFDCTDTETRKVLLAVNEADQNKVLVSLTSKLYDNVVDKVDDIDFGEIELTKGDLQKLPNYQTLNACLQNMRSLLIEFKQDTSPVDTVAKCCVNIEDSKDIWTKAYMVNAELPMITYNTMVLACIDATAYLVSMCVEFVKSPSQDTMNVMIDKSALTKSKGHMIFKNIESFNKAYEKGQVRKAMEHVIAENASKKNFMGVGIYGGIGTTAAIVGIAGLLFCIIPIIRELIFLFYYERVRVSDFFEAQADLLQVNAYNVENNRLDLTKEERKNISAKQMKVADRFRNISRTIAVSAKTGEDKAVKEIKAQNNKKQKISDVMDELPDSASSALF